MYPGAFCTEFSDFPTAFYEHPQESRCWSQLGGCPVAKHLTCKFKAKHLTCKFEAKTAYAPNGADSTGAAGEGQHEEQTPPPSVPPAAAAAPLTPEGQAGPSVD